MIDELVIASEARQFMPPPPSPYNLAVGYAPTQRIGEGLVLAMPWYVLQEKK